MTASERIRRLNALNLSQREEAARKLGALLAELTRQQERLDKLRQYNQEYQTQLRARLAGGVSAPELARFNRFLASLQQAIEQQEQQVALAEHNVGLGQLEWKNRHNEVHKLDTLSARLEASEALAARRAEQRQVDEANLQSHWRAREQELP